MLLCQVGYNAVSSTGGAGTWKPEWAKLFAAVRSIIILYDNDAAGRDGALRCGRRWPGHASPRTRTASGCGRVVRNHPAPVSWLGQQRGVKHAEI